MKCSSSMTPSFSVTLRASWRRRVRSLRIVLNQKGPPMPDEPSKLPDPPSNELEREESQLWRWALWPAHPVWRRRRGAVMAGTEGPPYRLWAIPAGLFCISILVCRLCFWRRREVSELKQLLKGFQNRAGVTPSEEQLDQLGQLIMRSQRNFKELIDSLDDVALAISLDGTLRTVNRRTAEISDFPTPTGRSQTGRFSRARHRGPREPIPLSGFWKSGNGRESVEVRLKSDLRRIGITIA